MLHTQRSHQFPKFEKSVIFGILAKGGPHEKLLQSWNFRNGWKWYILCKMRRWSRWCNGKVAAIIICQVISILVSEIYPPELALKTCSYPNICNAAGGQRRPWRYWKLLGMKILIKNFKKSGHSPETMLRTQRSRRFPNPEKSIIFFFILAKRGPHEKMLESWIRGDMGFQTF